MHPQAEHESILWLGRFRGGSGSFSSFRPPLRATTKKVVNILRKKCTPDKILATPMAKCATAEALRANIGSKSAISLKRWPVDPKILGRRVHRHEPFCFSEKKWSFVSYKSLDRSFFRFVTMHAFVIRMDRQTEFSSLDRVCIPCSAVKKKEISKVHQRLLRSPKYVGRPNKWRWYKYTTCGVG